MTPRSALDIIWARLNEAIGDKITAAADSADEAERQAGVATSEAEKAKAEADRARTEAAAEVDKLTAGAPEAFDTLKEISDELEKNETERAALANTLAKKADKDQIEAEVSRVEGAVFSRGEQAVVNGNGSLGMQYWGGHSSLEMSTKDAPPGTFASYSTPGRQAVIWNDVEVVIDPTLPTYMSGLFRQGAEGGKANAYLALLPIDQDGNRITAINVMYREDTLTELAEDLKPGDTEMKLVSAENWQNAGTSVARRIIFWDYISEDGKEWGPETYSRHTTGTDTWEEGAVDLATNTISLQAPWDEDLVPAGTPLSNGNNGSNYLYPAGQFIPTGEWTKFEGHVAPGVNRTGSGMSPTRGWPAGTTSVRVGVLMNYGSNSETSDTRFSNIHLSQVAPAGHDHASEDIADAVFRVGEADSYGKVFKASNTGRLYYTKETQYSDEVANKAYVDSAVSDKATVNYVDEKIDKTSYETSEDLRGLQREVIKAQGSANRGLSEIEDLEIGGRNYFLPSQVGNLGLPEDLSSEEGMVFGWASHDLATMKQEEELFGLTNGMLSTYSDFVQSPAFPRDYAQAAIDRGAELLVSWEPWDWYGETDNQPEFAPRRISAGEHDEWVTSWLTEAQIYAERIPVHVRFAPEMNDTARPWAALKEAKGYDPATAEEYVEMWQHVWEIKELVAPDVKLMWNPLNFGAGERPFEDYFPGSDYVDSVALNGFNWSNVQNPEGSWQSHDDVFGFGDDENSPVNRLIALANGKPWGLAEVASAPADPADFQEGGQYYDAWGSWVFEWPENPPYEETPEDWITQEGWTEMLIRRTYDKGASFLALFHTVKETDWRLTDTTEGRGVVQAAVDSGAKVKLGSSLDKNPNGELVTGASHRSFFLPVSPGERYTVSRTETSNNRFVYAFTGEAPRAGAKFVAPAKASSDLNDRLSIAGVRVPEGASHMVLHLSNRGDEIPKIMLEKGNRPSDWRPAPEETAEQSREFVNSRPALFHGHGPPGVIEGAVPGDKYMDLDEMEIYVLPEENA